MKKALIVAQKYSFFTEPIMAAFRRHGFDVSFVDYWGRPFLMPYGLPHQIFSKLPDIIRKPIEKREYAVVDRNILSAVRDLKPDIVLVSKGKNISLDVLDKIRQLSKTVNWYTETFDHWERILKIAPHYDHFFSFDPDLVSALHDEGINNAHYLPFCADILKDAKYPETKKFEHNITFVGSFEKSRYAKRLLFLNSIKDLGLSLWGNRAWLETELREYYRGFIPKEELTSLYRSSKIVLGMHVFGIKGSGTTNRPFDVTGAGAFLLNHDERKDIFNLFREGEEFVAFRDEKDLRAKAEHYLIKDDEREKIARAGFARTRGNHTYDDRIEKVIKILLG